MAETIFSSETSSYNKPQFWLPSLSSSSASSSCESQLSYPSYQKSRAVCLAAPLASGTGETAPREVRQQSDPLAQPSTAAQKMTSPEGDAQYEGDSLLMQIHAETHLSIVDLQALEAQGLLKRIPRNDSGELASVGSINHFDGMCSPCLFWFRKVCKNGLICSYCHFKHDGQKKKRIRPSKKTRAQRRGRSEHADSAAGDGEEASASSAEENEPKNIVSL